MKKQILIFSLLFVFTLIIISCKQIKTNKIMYEGKPVKAEISRDKNTKNAVLDIDTSESWKLYAGKTVETIDLGKAVLEGNGKGNFEIPLNHSDRSYFRLDTESGKMILAEKHLAMEGGYNFRDLGAYKTKDGKYLKWGKLFRSDDLANLSDKDLQYLSSISIATIVDFRDESEMLTAPDRLPANANYEKMSISPGNLFSGIQNIENNNIDSLMMEMNRLFVSDSTIIATYRNFFQVIQNEKNTPILYHCSAGKDRTGMASALILYALGVDEATIMDDYMLSSVYLADKYGKFIEQYPEAASLFTVKKNFLQAGIDLAKEKYGSIENFLTDHLDVDIDKMKKMYLY